MPQTPDRTPGPSDEEGTYYESTGLATAQGEVRYTGSRFSMVDATGEFDPRSGSGSSDFVIVRTISTDLTIDADTTRLQACDFVINNGVEVTIADTGELLVL